jgi:hypothetical protein
MKIKEGGRMIDIPNRISAWFKKNHERVVTLHKSEKVLQTELKKQGSCVKTKFVRLERDENNRIIGVSFEFPRPNNMYLAFAAWGGMAIFTVGVSVNALYGISPDFRGLLQPILEGKQAPEELQKNEYPNKINL